MIRWALLIALSSWPDTTLDRWTAALNVDQASTAVELEEGLAIAEGRVPH
jgi:hypothetical protein